MRIAFDLDSTLNMLSVPWEAWIRANGDPNFRFRDVTHWGVGSFSRIQNKVYDFLRTPGAFYHVPPDPEALTVTNALSTLGHELFLVSSCNGHAGAWGDKVRWAKENVPAIPEKNMMACARKGLLDVDILVDDGLHNFEGFKGWSVVRTQPWNRGVSSSIDRRIYNLIDMIGLVSELQSLRKVQS